MKVADLSGPKLDYWAAKAAGAPVEWRDHNGQRWLHDLNDYGGSYSPSTDWAQGGPVIEREHISLFDGQIERRGPFACLALKDAIIAAWSGEGDIRGTAEGVGDTPLIAAMRCFVTSRFGEEVPDE